MIWLAGVWTACACTAVTRITWGTWHGVRCTAHVLVFNDHPNDPQIKTSRSIQSSSRASLVTDYVLIIMPSLGLAARAAGGWAMPSCHITGPRVGPAAQRWCLQGCSQLWGALH
jgi:hypothetical protein